MVTYHVMKRTTWSPIVGQFFDTMIVASSDKEWAEQPIKIWVLETVLSHLKVIPQFALRIPTARVNERVHVHNERNFPQPKLGSEINVRFLLNEHGDLYFLSYYNSVHIIVLNLRKIKKLYRTEKRGISESLHKTVTVGCKLWPRKQLYESFTSTSF